MTVDALSVKVELMRCSIPSFGSVRSSWSRNLRPPICHRDKLLRALNLCRALIFKKLSVSSLSSSSDVDRQSTFGQISVVAGAAAVHCSRPLSSPARLGPFHFGTFYTFVRSREHKLHRVVLGFDQFIESSAPHTPN